MAIEADGSMVSRELGVRLRPEGRILRLLDLRTSEPIPTRPERIAFYQARVLAQQAKIEEQEAQLTEKDKIIAKFAEDLRRIQSLLRKAGIDPDAAK